MSYVDEKTVSKEKQDAVSDESGSIQHIDSVGRNAHVANPLAGIPHDKLMANAAHFAREHGLEHITEELQKGALVAQDPSAFESLTQLSEEDKAVFRREITHRWDQPWQLYYLVILCSMAAAVQGVSKPLSKIFLIHSVLISQSQMDESVINGANLFFPDQFGIGTEASNPNASRNQWLLGLVNSAPYVSREAPTALMRIIEGADVFRSFHDSCAAVLSHVG